MKTIRKPPPAGCFAGGLHALARLLLDEVRTANAALQYQTGLTPDIATAAAGIFFALTAPALLSSFSFSIIRIIIAGSADRERLAGHGGQCRLISQSEVLKILAGESLENLFNLPSGMI